MRRIRHLACRHPGRGGYWRADASSVQVYSCPLPDDCRAGVHVSDAACAPGYKGAACGTCEFPQFYLEATAIQCSECGATSLGTLFVVGGVSGALLVGSAVYASYWASVHRVKIRASVTLRSLSMARLKILWVTVQILCSVTSTLDVAFPEPFRGLLGLFDFLMLDFGFLPLGCVQKFS